MRQRAHAPSRCREFDDAKKFMAGIDNTYVLRKPTSRSWAAAFHFMSMAFTRKTLYYLLKIEKNTSCTAHHVEPNGTPDRITIFALVNNVITQSMQSGFYWLMDRLMVSSSSWSSWLRWWCSQRWRTSMVAAAEKNKWNTKIYERIFDSQISFVLKL